MQQTPNNHLRPLPCRHRDPNHLLIHCHFTKNSWLHFASILQQPHIPQSLEDLWGNWSSFKSKASWMLLAKAITWHIWFGKMNAFSISSLFHLFVLLQNLVIYSSIVSLQFLQLENNNQSKQHDGCMLCLNFILKCMHIACHFV